jgi:hypothetical protein
MLHRWKDVPTRASLELVPADRHRHDRLPDRLGMLYGVHSARRILHLNWPGQLTVPALERRWLWLTCIVIIHNRDTVGDTWRT